MHSVLIVDDNVDICDVIAITLRANGYKVNVATSRRDAFTVLNDFNPDAVILDYCMADGAVDDLMSLLDRKRLCSRTILFTAHSEIEKKQRQLGLSYAIRKPFDTDVLLDTLRLLLEASAQNDGAKDSTKNLSLHSS